MNVPLVVVADLDFVRSIGAPDEADPPLLVDANAVLPGPVASEALQAIPGWTSEVSQRTRRIQ